MRDLLSPSGAGLEGVEMNNMDIQAVQVRTLRQNCCLDYYKASTNCCGDMYTANDADIPLCSLAYLSFPMTTQEIVLSAGGNLQTVFCVYQLKVCARANNSCESRNDKNASSECHDD